MISVEGLEDSLAMGRMVVMAVAILAVMVITQVEAVLGSSDMANKVEFASGLQDMDLARSQYHEDAVDEFLDVPTRRILGTTTTYISYDALSANRAPCPSGTAVGSSYYGCTPTGTATPYTRSCTALTKCARG